MANDPDGPDYDRPCEMCGKTPTFIVTLESDEAADSFRMEQWLCAECDEQARMMLEAALDDGLDPADEQ